ncbi:hypothetical protein MBLNU230_g5402t1 [Neophaeotheca triangularis]
MSKSMFADWINPSFVLSPERTFSYEDREKPAVQSPRDVVVQIVATGLCGSDVHYWLHGAIGQYVVDKPIVLGHESAGIVVDRGSDATDLQVGDRVALEPGIACNSCDECRRGAYNLCPGMRFAATPPYDGTLAKYYRLPRENVFRLPEALLLRDAALIEPLSIAVHVCRLAGSMHGKSVAIFGAGPVGQLCANVSSAFGADTVAVSDVVLSRLEFAKEKGASYIYEMTRDSAAQNATALTKKAGLPFGFDIIIDATGAEPCISCGVNALKRGGIFVQAGLGKAEVQFPVGAICDKEATFKGSFRYGPGDYDIAVKLIKSKRVDLGGYVTHEYGFGEAEAAFQNVADRSGVKSVIYGPGVDSKDAIIGALN